MSVQFAPSPAAGLYLKDDFFTNSSVATAAIGELDWDIVTIGNASTYAHLVTTDTGVNEFGVVRMTTAATADGDGSVLRQLEDNLVLGPNGGFLRFKVRYPVELASHNFRIGLQDSVTATSPTVGLWVDSDAGVITLQADSADHGDASAAAANNPGAAPNTLTGGTTMVVATWHTFFLTWGGQNAQGGPADAELYCDGHLVAKLVDAINIDDDEEMEFSIVHWQDAGVADAVALDIDYIELFLGRAQ